MKIDRFCLSTPIDGKQVDEVSRRLRNLTGVFSVRYHATDTVLTVEHTPTISRKSIEREMVRLGVFLSDPLAGKNSHNVIGD